MTDACSLTKEMQAASSRILTSKSSNCSAISSQMLLPERDRETERKRKMNVSQWINATKYTSLKAKVYFSTKGRVYSLYYEFVAEDDSLYIIKQPADISM